MRPRTSPLSRIGRIIGEIALLGGALVFIAPLLIGLNVSLKADSTPGTENTLTTAPVFTQYLEAWSQGSMGTAILVSVLITGISVLTVLLLAGLAAYPLARSTRRWSKVAFAGFALGLLLPYQLSLVPLYQTMRTLHLLGNPLSVILFEIGIMLPTSIFIIAGFLRAVPRDYEEAAAIDGAGPVRTFFQIIVPLIRPALGTVAILSSVFVWNDFLTPLLFLTGSGNLTAPLAVFSFTGQYVENWPLIFAALFIAMSPIIVLFVVLQKFVIRGFASGLKG